jgi:alpha 1,2-mannosyltransferase
MAKSGMRVVRFVAIAVLLILAVYKLSNQQVDLSSYVASKKPSVVGTTGSSKEAVREPEKEVDTKPSGMGSGLTDQQPVSAAPYQRANATFVTLARNEDLHSLMLSIQGVEDRFNDKYHYSWVFLNDKEFSDEFKEATSSMVSGETYYGLIPKEHWSYPEWIDQEQAALTREKMAGVIYGSSVTYRHMCRYESGFFWRHPLLDQFKYYWRVEPDVKFHCDINYDLFKFMEDNKKSYGWTISLPEYIETIPTLWDTTKDFLAKNPQYKNENSLIDFISDDGGETYNRCHYWSNFEIADLDFWRSDAYRAYFDHLDHAGGFFYERWGDAPVHSIAASLLLDKSQVHFFEDVGYFHVPFNSCPTTKEDRLKLRCTCNVDEIFTWKGYSCTSKFYNAQGMQRPKGWHELSD